MMQNSNEVFLCVKEFFIDCFTCLSDPEFDVYNFSFDDIVIVNLKQKIEEIVKHYKEFKNGHPGDVFFLLTHRGIRAAINEFTSMTIYNETALLEGITTDGEINVLFFDLANEYSESDNANDIKNLLESCLDELYEIESEYQTLMVYTLNTMKVSSDNYMRAASDLMSSQRKLIKDIETRSKDLSLKSEALDGRIDGTFEKLKTHEQRLEKDINQTHQKISSLTKKIQSSEKRMYEANVTILGIFSAIVLTFSTTVNFFSAVVSSFSSASSYKFFLILLVVGLISVCALAGLFHYLWKVREDRQLLSLIKLLTPPKESSDTKKKKRISHIQIFKTTIAILLALMAIVSIAWGFGLIERRNSYVSNKLSIRSFNSRFEDNDLLSMINLK